MHIQSIEVFHVALPLRQSLATPDGETQKLETVLVRMSCNQTSGWGEASPGAAPWGGPEWAAGVFGCIRDWLAPAVVGTEVDSGDHLQQRLGRFQGNRHAKGALDAAWWDLAARLDGKSLPELLGATRPKVEVGTGFDQMDSVDEFMKKIGQAFEAGFSRVELKFRPGWDLQMLNAVRQEFPTQTLHIDCEAGMRLEHMETIARIDDFGIAMVEQPLAADDLVGHAMVQEMLRTPVCLDEGITTPDQADMALELKSCQFVNLKPGRVGGITPALAICEACGDQEVPCWVGALPQSAIGSRTGMALAGKENCTYPADLFLSGTMLEEDLASPPEAIQEEDGVLRVPLWDEPGLGVEPDPARLEKYCLNRAVIA